MLYEVITEDGLYIYDYKLFELFGELGFRPGDFPVQFFFDYVKNVADNVAEDQGWLVGASVGETKDPGSWEVRYIS